ncbi:MAG: Crp/Fnr family transcriptional regulator [Clostridia bacterium]|nr:Crp/Fnr family transcriptional regulator [Clostridia bacterium]
MKLEELINEQPKLKEILSGMPWEISSRCVLKKFRAGSAIIKKDDTVKYVYLLVKGELRVINEFENGNIYIFGRNLPMSFNGELEALSGEKQYAITLEAVTDCVAICISIDDFNKWMEMDHSALLIVSKELAKKMYPTSSENGNILFRPGLVKVQSYLVKYSNDKIKEGETFQISRNRQQIADEIGISVKTVNRCIKKLKDEGLLSIKKGKVYISKNQHLKLAAAIKDK